MDDRKLTYEELLEDNRWKAVRLRILHRDQHKCQLCGGLDNLNVHHRYYIFQHAPWSYIDQALITLCQSCHKMVHDTLPPIVYAQSGNVLKPMNFTPCSRCGGYGYFSEYKHIQGGICFKCKGEKYEELINAKTSDTLDKYIDYDKDVFDSVNPIEDEKIEEIFQKGRALHKKNPIAAKEYYLIAAKSGYGKAQNNLGLILEAEGDYIGAKRWMLYSAMQGIYQGKSNLTDLLRKTEGTTLCYKLWFNFMIEDKDYQSKIAFEVFAKLLKSAVNDEPAPSFESLYMAMDILTTLASQGHEQSKILVSEYKIDEIYKETLAQLKSNDGKNSI